MAAASKIMRTSPFLYPLCTDIRTYVERRRKEGNEGSRKQHTKLMAQSTASGKMSRRLLHGVPLRREAQSPYAHVF